MSRLLKEGLVNAVRADLSDHVCLITYLGHKAIFDRHQDITRKLIFIVTIIVIIIELADEFKRNLLPFAKNMPLSHVFKSQEELPAGWFVVDIQ